MDTEILAAVLAAAVHDSKSGHPSISKLVLAVALFELHQLICGDFPLTKKKTGMIVTLQSRTQRFRISFRWRRRRQWRCSTMTSLSTKTTICPQGSLSYRTSSMIFYRTCRAQTGKVRSSGTKRRAPPVLLEQKLHTATADSCLPQACAR